jgi:hypothetical protein
MKDRITPEDVEASIKKVEYTKLGTKMTAATVTMTNGHEVVGLAGCVNPANFDLKIGGPIALNKAKDQIWALLGYQLQEATYLKGSDEDE